MNTEIEKQLFIASKAIINAQSEFSEYLALDYKTSTDIKGRPDPGHKAELDAKGKLAAAYGDVAIAALTVGAAREVIRSERFHAALLAVRAAGRIEDAMTGGSSVAWSAAEVQCQDLIKVVKNTAGMTDQLFELIRSTNLDFFGEKFFTTACITRVTAANAAEHADVGAIVGDYHVTDARIRELYREDAEGVWGRKFYGAAPQIEDNDAPTM